MTLNTNTQTGVRSRQLLAEGAEGAFPIDTAYVRKGAQVCILIPSQNKDATICEGEDVQIVESLEAMGGAMVKEEVDGQIIERVKVEGGAWVVEGPYQRSDVKNINRRTYPRALWERLIADSKSDVQQRVAQRQMIGHVEHPKDGRTDLKESALLTTALTLRKDGVVWGRSELLDTPNGRILQELTRKKIRWGVSSRGNGEVKSDGVVESATFALECFDGVAKPSTPGAFPNPVTEKTEQTHTESVAESNRTVYDNAALNEMTELLGSDVVLSEGKDQLAYAAHLLRKWKSAIPNADPARVVALTPTMFKRIHDLHASAVASVTGGMSPLTESHAPAARRHASEDTAERRVIARLQERVVSASEDAQKCRRVLRKSESSRQELAERIANFRVRTPDDAPLKRELAECRRQLDAAIAALSSAPQPVEEQLTDEVRYATTKRLLEAVPALAGHVNAILAAPSEHEMVGRIHKILTESVVPESDANATRRDRIAPVPGSHYIPEAATPSTADTRTLSDNVRRAQRAMEWLKPARTP